MIAFSIDELNGLIAIDASDGHSAVCETLDEALGFLMERQGLGFRVCWDLDECVAPLLKLLSEVQLKELFGYGKVVNGDFTLLYNYHKNFAVRRKFVQVNYYHLCQYYPELEKPALDEVQKLGQQLLDELATIQVKPTSLSSGISIMDGRYDPIPLPTWEDAPDDVDEFAWQCAHRAWTEAHQIGKWDMAYDYDIRCYSEDTEVLTFTGWQKVTELAVGTSILTFNPSIDRCEFQPVLYMNISPYTGDMVSMTVTKADLLVTPNHKMLFKNHIRCKNSRAYKNRGGYGYGAWETREAGQLPKGNIRLPISYPMLDRFDAPVSDGMLQLIAWIVTEGHTTRYKDKVNGICITQTEASGDNIKYCSEILQCLEQSGMRYSHHKRRSPYNGIRPIDGDNLFEGEEDIRLWGILKTKYGIKNSKLMAKYTTIHEGHNYRIRQQSVNDILPLLESNIHHIPLWILQTCSLRQLRLFFDTLIKGDGSIQYKGGTCNRIGTSFYSNWKITADRMMYLCHLLGYKVSYKCPNKSHTTYQLFINVHEDNETGKSNHHDIDINYGAYGSEKIAKIPYSGMVACPTVQNGFIVVRRNGKSCISGNSAYPAVLGDLWDFRPRYGDWVNQVERPKDAMYGFVYGRIKVTGRVSPAIFISADGHGYSTTGGWTDYMTMSKLDCLRRHDIGDMVIKDAHWWVPTKKVQPLLITVHWLYKQRSKSPLLNRVIKLGLNGLYGKMLQVFPDGNFGKRFNPVWGAFCEEETAVKVTDFIYDRGLTENVIHIATDGVLFDKPAGEVENKGLGAWKEDSTGPAIVIDSSNVFYGKKRPNSLTYEQGLELIQGDPENTEWHRKIKRRMTMGDVLQGTSEGIGDYKEVETGFRLKNVKEHDRKFKHLPKTGAELLANTYQSIPLSCHTLKSGMELDTTQYEE